MNTQPPQPQTAWGVVPAKPHHGINLPLFALRSQNSCGIGEYPDLLPMISWCRSLGFDVIQLLPLNDTGSEVSPYAAWSAFALNPLYLGLTALPYVDQIPALSSLISELQSFSAFERIDYPKVIAKKENFLQSYFRYASPTIMATKAYQQFVQKHSSWLLDFALYKAMRQHYAIEKLPVYTSIAELKERWQYKFAQEINYHSFIQFLCFSQMQQVKDQAEKEGLWLKGDIPILIGRYSADTWLFPELFICSYSAGAPPDSYASTGQNWGFPLYNWEAMAKQDYHWWKQRLAVASDLYHIYRLDHIVGFFRIWAIAQEEKDGLHGFYYPQEEKEWIPQGQKILATLIAHSPLLPIGEDLGTVPQSVRQCMQQLGICGTKVMRWERYWEKDGSFIPIDQYTPLSLTTVSTHDSETLRQWWSNQPQEASILAKQQGWQYSEQITSEQYRELLRQSHNSASLFHINLLNEYFPLVADLTWPHLEDERINIPGTFSERNWSYRFRPYLEELTTHSALATAIHNLLPSP